MSEGTNAIGSIRWVKLYQNFYRSFTEFHLLTRQMLEKSLAYLISRCNLERHGHQKQRLHEAPIG